LRWLAADCDNLLASTATLQAATALEFIAVTGGDYVDCDWSSLHAATFVGWLLTHPPLHRLAFEAFQNLGTRVFDSPFLKVHVALLRQLRPSLQVHFVNLEGCNNHITEIDGSFLQLLGAE
jgi:hypothetical protein